MELEKGQTRRLLALDRSLRFARNELTADATAQLLAAMSAGRVHARP